MATLANMTLEELKRLIEEIIDERLTKQLGTFEIEATDADDDTTWDEVRTFVERQRWTPPHGSKSSLELLREDRDR